VLIESLGKIDRDGLRVAADLRAIVDSGESHPLREAAREVLDELAPDRAAKPIDPSRKQ
jgi:hypothetical protein